MSEDKIDAVLKKVEALPPLPAAVTKLCSLAGNLNTDIREINQVISSDQALTGHLLRVANSAFYGLSQRVRTISHAVVILGFREVRNLALGFSLVGSKLGKGENSPLDHKEFWRHSLATACVSRMVARQLAMPEPEEAFVAGLIHDIGKLIFMEYFPEPYRQALRKADTGQGPLFAVEERLLGVNHATVGRRLCRHWKLPDTITHTVFHHHRPVEEKSTPSAEDLLAAAVRIADNVAKIAGIGNGGSPHVEEGAFSGPVAKRLPVASLPGLVVVLPEEVKKIETLFGLSPGPEVALRPNDTPPRVALLVRSQDIAGIVALVLIRAGYLPVPVAELPPGSGSQLAGIILENARPDEVQRLGSSHGIPVLDLKEWRGRQPAASPGCIDLRQLRAWLAASLRSAAVEDAV